MGIASVLFEEVYQILEKIVDEQYEALGREGKLIGVSEEEIREILARYGAPTRVPVRRLVDDFAYRQLRQTNFYKGYLNLWLDGERSGLYLVCAIGLDGQGRVVYSAIDEIHVTRKAPETALR
ncbi:DUF7668 domain-containing protein [Zongyangia hominis]|uniref:DUF7668 domain-containing protein n=1 Tax=Zongyangia hominis TaxID=2763677 RepID=A0A926EBX2_9FIRM|nr:hypothetical protein [Zongyangia hominis]MBC8570233.1 hypothetical protein [Zongyangia hominis]